MDSRAYWFGAAIALAVLLFWREVKEGQANNFYGNGSGAGYSGGYPGTTTTTGLPGGTASVGCGCGEKTVYSPFTSPSMPNPSAPASMSSFGNNRTAVPSSLQRTYINAYGFRVPVGAGN